MTARYALYIKRPWSKRSQPSGFYTDNFERQKRIADNHKKESPRDVVRVKDMDSGKYVYTA